MESKYSSFSRDIIHGYEKVLASIFIKLYVDLYKWLSKSFSIHEDYIDLDKDLAFEADAMDLIEAAQLVRLNIFGACNGGNWKNFQRTNSDKTYALA